MTMFKVDGVELTGLDEGSGHPVLMLHGAGGPPSTAAAAQRLSQQFQVVVPTHPGFGDCAEVERIDTVDDLAYLYLDLLDSLKLTDVCVMGFSMGGWIACEMAVKSTARIGRLVLVDAVGIRVPGADIADLFALHPKDAAGFAYHDPKYAPDAAKFSDAEKLSRARSQAAFARYAWEPYLHNPKLTQRLHRIDKPTLVIWGENDRVVSADYGRKFAAAIPGAQFVSIPNCGHVPQVEAAEKFDALVSDFVQGRKAAAE
jgi:pimeloyl-ACP methyl ester carboxylesterase